MPRPANATLCIPTHNGAETIGRVLRAALSQNCDIPYDVLVIDTESIDGTRQIVTSFPVRLRTIHKDEFDHGDTRNLAASLTDSEIVVYLTQDAIPADEHWLAELLTEFEDERVAGVYSRNLPHPGSSPLVSSALSRDPSGAAERRVREVPGNRRQVLENLDPLERRLTCDFNDVSSAIRRSVWERFPFPRTNFGEDVLWARGALEAGHKIVYAPASKVFHGHDDPAKVAYARAVVDGRFNAEHLDRICIRSLGDAVKHGMKLAWMDHKHVKQSAARRVVKWRERLRAPRLRVSQMVGLWSGGRVVRRVKSAKFVATDKLKILFTVHGYPPESTAGTEVYTRNLARELAARGHDVTVLYRSVRSDVPDLSLTEGRDGAIRVFALANRLDYRHAGESYVNPEVEARFRDVLDMVKPDVVHFQHLLHLSARLVEVANERGVPTVLTLNDYWCLCPRVQLQRPNGKNCAGRRELGCVLCLKQRYVRGIDTVTRGGRALRPLVEAVVRRAEKKWRQGWTLQKRDRDLVDFFRRDATMVKAFTSADLLLAPSRFLRDLFLRQIAELDARRIVLSDYGIRADELVARARKPRDPRQVSLGFVGSLVPYKGIEIAVEAMNRLGDPRAVLHVFGRFEPLTDPFHAKIEKLVKHGNVVFRGPFQNDRLPEVLGELDALVVPSTWYENAPLTIREAHLAGVPTVVSNLGGMAESVREGLDGWTFAPGDAGDLASVLLRLISELDKGRREFVERKTIVENAREMEFRYRALLSAKAATRPRVVNDWTGSACQRSTGAVEPQGKNLVLLRPSKGASSILYGFDHPQSEEVEVVVEVLAFGEEPLTTLGGTVKVNGAAAGELRDFRALDGRDAVWAWRVKAQLRPGRNEIMLTNAHSDGTGQHLRVRRVSVEAHAV